MSSTVGSLMNGALLNALSDDVGNAVERNLVVQEGGHGSLVRRVQGAGNISAFIHCLVGERQCREPLGVRLGERNASKLREVQLLIRERQPLRESYRELDRSP